MPEVATETSPESHRYNVRDASGQFTTNGAPKAIRQTRLTRLFDAIVADFGGNDALSAIDRAYIQQACMLQLRAKREQDPNHVVRLTNAAVRLLSKVQPRNAPPTESVTLAALLADKGR